jgi:transposase
VAIKNSAHGQLFRLGVVIDEEVSDVFSPKGREILGRLDLDAHERRLLDGKLTVVEELTRHIDAMERELTREIADDPAAEIVRSLPGVGHLTAYTWLAEMGDAKRFPNGRALAAYGGVLPLDRESAEKDFGKHTNRSCNKYLRWAALEAVGGAVRKSPRMRALYERVKAKHPDQKGKARVAVARELLELAHLLLTRGEMYQERPPARPGSAEHRRSGKTRHPNRASQITLCARPEK